MNAQALLLYGDDSGAINLLYFKHPGKQLFKLPFSKKTGSQRVFFPVSHHRSGSSSP